MLYSMCLDTSMFEASARMAGGETPFEQMTVAQLKEELTERGERRSGLKHVLQRRLHGLIVQGAVAAVA